MNFLSRLFSKPDPAAVPTVVPDGLTPERVKELEAMVAEVRMNGRPIGLFLKSIRHELMEAGRGAPVVIEDGATGTTTIPADFDGLIVLIASWDSLLLDEELSALRVVVNQLVPAGLNQQHQTRMERAQEEAEMKHIETEHPEEWHDMQGIEV